MTVELRFGTVDDADRVFKSWARKRFAQIPPPLVGGVGRQPVAGWTFPALRQRADAAQALLRLV